MEKILEILAPVLGGLTVIFASIHAYRVNKLYKKNKTAEDRLSDKYEAIRMQNINAIEIAKLSMKIKHTYKSKNSISQLEMDKLKESSRMKHPVEL